MATASSMIISSLIMNGEKSIGGTLTSAEQTHYLAKLNAMLESWSIDRLMCYQIVQESKALTTGTGSYTIGSGGAWNTTRPTKIVDPCFIMDSANSKYEVTLIDAKTYGKLSPETAGNGIPDYLFYDSAYVSSLATIFLYPKPSASLTLYINSWKQLTQFATIGETVALPPGYQRAIESNFAIESAPGLKSVDPEVVKIARESMAAIKNLNAPSGVLLMPENLVSCNSSGGPSGRRYNIRTG